MTILTHYLELKAIPQIEMPQPTVINHLMQLLHNLLPAYNGKIGLSFPAYGQLNTLGGIIRLLGSEMNINKIHTQITQSHHFVDYTLITPIQQIPQDIKSYVRFKRIRKKGKSDLRRAEKRLKLQEKWTISIGQAMIEKWGGELLTLPHIHLISGSTKQSFTLWIKQQRFNNPIEGLFNAYGLSQNATVPFF